MSKEIWKEIFYGYKISSLGKVESKNGVLIKKNLNKHGYDRVVIKGKTYSVHRLVGYAFLGLDLNDSKTLICHKNDIRDDNHIDNLFLGTHKDNMQDALRKGRMKFNIDKRVKQYTLEGKFIKDWESCKSVRLLGITSHASSCALGKRKSAGGFIWKY